MKADRNIKMFFNCVKCLEELPSDQSPSEWARLNVGFTREGIQVVCQRHNLNVVHIHFLGQQFPADSREGIFGGVADAELPVATSLEELNAQANELNRG